MFYNPNIPGANDRIKKSYRDIRANFQVTDTAFLGDHVALTDEDTNRRGMHNKVSLILQSSDPTTAANENALYSKENGNNTDAYVRDESNGTVFPVTSTNALNIGLKLEAFCVIIPSGPLQTIADVTFQVAEAKYELPDGTEVTQALASSNIGTIDANSTASRLKGIINFTSPLSTANYFWVIEANSRFFNRPNPFFEFPYILNPLENAAYSSSITQSKFEFWMPYAMPLNINQIDRIIFKAYTVAT